MLAALAVCTCTITILYSTLVTIERRNYRSSVMDMSEHSFNSLSDKILKPLFSALDLVALACASFCILRPPTLLLETVRWSRNHLSLTLKSILLFGWLVLEI